jgi:hypothetical protein
MTILLTKDHMKTLPIREPTMIPLIKEVMKILPIKDLQVQKITSRTKQVKAIKAEEAPLIQVCQGDRTCFQKFILQGAPKMSTFFILIISLYLK